MSIVCSDCGAPLKSEMTRCPKCGSVNRHISTSDELKISLYEKVSWEHIREYYQKNPRRVVLNIALTGLAWLAGTLLPGWPGWVLSGVLTLVTWLVPPAIKVREITRGGS